MGGVPSFLVGAIPIGHDSKGNPLLINPFSLNPVGTGLQEMDIAAGTLQEAFHPETFSKYAQQDWSNLLPPLGQALLQAREGGKPVPEQLPEAVAGYKLYQGLRHPGAGSIYPTSRLEAAGKFVAGGLMPRRADQAAITRALQREQADHPAALIPTQVKMYEKATGEKIPQQMIGEYKADLEMIDELKTFQHTYAKRHGSSGFRNLPPQNKLEAAIAFLEKYSHAPDNEIASMKQDAASVQTDEEANSLANALFASTGIGTMKREWDTIMRDSRGMQLTRKRR
jgi:hypothetical protein